MPNLEKKQQPIPSDLKGLKDLLGIVSRGKYMWESTFDAIRDPVMIIGRDYRIQRANVALARRAGYPIEQSIGKRCYEVFAKREKICPRCPLERTLQTDLPGSVEIDSLIAKLPGGDFRVSSYPLNQMNDPGGPHVVHHYRDITEERRLQRQLIQSEKMAAIGMLAGGVAHEINNPLAGILAFAQILKKELPSEGNFVNDLGEIEEAARRCKKIVEDLLLFARPHQEGNKISLVPQEAIDKILPLARLNLRHQNVLLMTQYETGLPTVKGNIARLQQVFLNLLHNAGQSMLPQGGVVTLCLKSSPDRSQVIAEVVDKGCGIPSEDLPKIFDPFFSTKAKTQGTGLGLSICYSIVSEHGGKIEVESEAGKGSLFRVILPAEGVL